MNIFQLILQRFLVKLPKLFDSPLKTTIWLNRKAKVFAFRYLAQLIFRDFFRILNGFPALFFPRDTSTHCTRAESRNRQVCQDQEILIFEEVMNYILISETLH